MVAGQIELSSDQMAKHLSSTVSGCYGSPPLVFIFSAGFLLGASLVYLKSHKSSCSLAYAPKKPQIFHEILSMLYHAKCQSHGSGQFHMRIVRGESLMYLLMTRTDAYFFLILL